MEKLLMLAVLFLGFSSLNASSVSNMPNNGGNAPNSASFYQIELDKVLKMSPDVDFLKFRMAFANTDDFPKYAYEDIGLLNSVIDSFSNSEFERCLTISEKILSTNYTSLMGHLHSGGCNFKLGKLEKSKYHHAVLTGLLDSIRNSGDGKSTETAYITISVSELRTFLRLEGFQIRGQALLEEDERMFDYMSVKNRETGEKSSVYFDVTISWGR